MTAPKLTAALAKEYNDLFNRCEIAADKITEVEGVVQRILDFQNRYAAIAAQSTVPWYVTAVIHNMECGLDFTKHLHIRDNVWSDKAVSRQCGAAVILRSMSDHGAIGLVSPPSSKLIDAATLAEVPRHLFDG